MFEHINLKTIDDNGWIYYLPWNFIWSKVLVGVRLAEKLHPEDGENVDDNDKEESEVAKSTQS